MLHICDVCYKTFKTNQHLTQHKNRKFKCKPYVVPSNDIKSSNNHSEHIEFKYPDNPRTYLLNNIPANINIHMNENKEDQYYSSQTSSNISSRLSTPKQLSNVSHQDNENVAINYDTETNEIESNSIISGTDTSIKSNGVSQTTISSNSNECSFDNLSVSNLLEFMNTHKKVLEEKNKLETTLMILKNKIAMLNRENYELKNKICIVNGFIHNYKSSGVTGSSNNEIDNSDLKQPFSTLAIPQSPQEPESTSPKTSIFSNNKKRTKTPISE